MITPFANVQTRQFNSMLNQLARESSKNDEDFITDQSRRLIRSLAYNTPRAPTTRQTDSGRRRRIARRGRARAGWWQAWKRLGVNGTPYVGKYNLAKATEGGYEDGRKRLGRRFFTMFNTVPYIETLDHQFQILAKSTSRRLADMVRQYERKLSRSLRKFSG